MLVLLFQVIQVLTLGHVRGQSSSFAVLYSTIILLSGRSNWYSDVLQSQCGKCFSSVKHCIPCAVSQQKLKDYGKCSVQVQSVKKMAAELLTNLK